MVADVAHGESAYPLSDPDPAVVILKESERPEAIILVIQANEISPVEPKAESPGQELTESNEASSHLHPREYGQQKPVR